MVFVRFVATGGYVHGSTPRCIASLWHFSLQWRASTGRHSLVRTHFDDAGRIKKGTLYAFFCIKGVKFTCERKVGLMCLDISSRNASRRT